MESLFIHYLTMWRPLGYSLVFLGVMVEGDLFMLITASLVRLGYFDVVDMFLILYLGTLIGDMGWFYLGKKAVTSTNRYIQKLASQVHSMSVKTESGFFYKLALSKFMYGAHRPYLFSLGAHNIPLTKFLPNQLGAIFIWIAVIGNIGYWFGALLASTKHILKYTEIGILLLVTVYLVVSHYLRTYEQKHHLTDTL